MDYELKAFVADKVEDKIHKRNRRHAPGPTQPPIPGGTGSEEYAIHKRNSVMLAIRKLIYAAEEPAPPPRNRRCSRLRRRGTGSAAERRDSQGVHDVLGQPATGSHARQGGADTLPPSL